MKCKMALCLVMAICFQLQQAFAQNKKPLDLEAIDKWTYVERPMISADGNYSAVVIKNQPMGSKTVLVQNNNSQWKREVIASKTGYEFSFSSDSRYFLFSMGKDSICVMKLGSDEMYHIAEAGNMLFPDRKFPYLIYTSKSEKPEVVVYNLFKKQKQFSFAGDNPKLSPDKQLIVMQTVAGDDSLKKRNLVWFDLISGELNNICDNVDGDVKFSSTSDVLVFLAKLKEKSSPCIMSYSFKKKVAETLACAAELPEPQNSNISSIVGFNRNGDRIYLKCAPQNQALTPSAKKAKVDLWSYNDVKLKSDNRDPSSEFLCAMNINDRNIYKLTNPGENFYSFDADNTSFSDEWLLCDKSESGTPNEDYWNQTNLMKVTLVSTIDGRRKLIDSSLRWTQATSYKLSPSGQYILYFDAASGNYKSYSTASQLSINLTADINDKWDHPFFKILHKRSGVFVQGAMGWIDGTDDVLLRSQYDIWRIDVSGKKAPVCITKGYGAKNRIEFRGITTSGVEKTIYDANKRIILSSFNSANKQNGFFAADPGGRKELEKLVMNDYAYFAPHTAHSWGEIPPEKARDTDAWIVARQSCNESVNYYFTRDFKKYKALTYNFPEKNYNWMKAELVEWKMDDGSISQGILYKPDNFDSTKKYPLIFQYYEELSNNLNVFLKPERATCDINIPYYVSNGYLVFTPDIKRTAEGAGQDALNTMVSAGKHLATYSYIDPKKMGICGHSMGGYKTNFIVTHTNMFAAANANAGPSNISAWALNLWAMGLSQPHVELGQFYIGYSIAERPDLYVKNSPIFYLNNVRTPLLIMNNKEDEGNWMDGIAIFKALRREGKKVWMLDYEGHGHFLNDEDTVATTDWTIRQKQYFDHYLMNKPAAVWMTQGISTKLKQVEDGLQLDTNTFEPVGKLLIGEERKRVEESITRPGFSVLLP